MSSPLAIGAVSAVLRNLLDDGMIEAGAAIGSTVNVSAVAPDTIDLQNTEEPPRLNLFLHQVTPNSGWRNLGLPSRGADSGERLTNAPLALDLHYILTAYARADFQAEILLGYAMHLLHERPVLDRAAVRRALNPSPLDVSMLPPAFQALAASDLADQMELLKVTPASMSADEMSKLWAAILTHYRPSAAYTVSVVLIEGTHPGRSPLPVLSRGPRDPVTHRDRGAVVNADMLPPLPTLFETVPQLEQTGTRLGEPVGVTGVRLSGSGHRVRLTHRLVQTPIEIVPSPAAITDTGGSFALPDDLAAQGNLCAGQWSLSLAFTPDGETGPRETNAIPLVLAPAPVIAPDPALGLPGVSIVRGGAPPRVTVTIFSRPRVRPEQRATLILDGVESVATPRTAATDPLIFVFPDSLSAASHWLRLRVDGTDSILLDRTGPEPVFDPSQQVTVPA
jgi:Pvc16 N-terminal domain